MRGQHDPQHFLFTYVSPESRVPAGHPLRTIKAYADAALKELSATFDEMYSRTGRPSIPPERLLKSQLLIALYSVRSDRLFCETLDYNMLYRWFLDMSLEDPSFDASTFSKNRDRLLEHGVALKFFDAVVRRARREGLLSDDHFTVDGTLIEAWASLKSFRPKDGSGDAPPDDPGNPTVNFHGEKRSNQTHESTTDPQARLARKGNGREARLSYCGNVLMENRHGLCVDLTVGLASGFAEREGAAHMLDRQGRKRVRPRTLGGDKGFHTWDFVELCRERGIIPHIAMKSTRIKARLDGRTTRHESYAISQRVRMRVEEIFGWMKTVGGLRKTRFRGPDRIQQHAHWIGAAYNLLRMSKLRPIAGIT